MLLNFLLAQTAFSFVQVPGGRLVRPDCHHTVPTGTHIHETDTHFIFSHASFPNGTKTVALCGEEGFKLGHGDAWKTWAQFKQPGSVSVTSLSNKWTVPKEPTKKGDQILYYWNGIEDGDRTGGKGVLQPVLQWTRSTGWAIKSWFVGAGGTVTSELLATPSGSTVTGRMQQDTNGTWVVTGTTAAGKNATLFYSRKTLTFTYAYEVLEAYNVGASCSMYPADGATTFSGTEVSFDHKAVSDIKWEPFSCPSGPGCIGSASCGEKTTVDGSSITIHYDSS